MTRAANSMFAVLLGLSGCATIELSEPTTTAEAVGRKTRTQSTDDTAVAIDQTGMEVELRARRICGDQEFEQTQVIEKRERINASPGADWGWGVVGVGLAGTGTAILIDAGNVSTSDKNGREFNPVGPDVARVSGAVGIGLGAIALTVVVVDVIRAQGSARYERSQEQAVGGVGNLRACGAAKNVEIFASVESEHVSLGRTDANGHLRFNIEDVLASRKLDVPERMEIVVQGTTVGVGTVDLSELRGEQDDRNWKLAKPEQCAEPQSTFACDAVNAYIKQFPSGIHAQEARTILASATPKLTVLRDEARWGLADVDACRRRTSADACDGVEGYLKAYPQGLHAGEAQRLLNSAREQLAALAEREAREVQRWAVREAAEERRNERAETRAWAAAERAETRHAAQEEVARQRESRQMIAGVVAKVFRDHGFAVRWVEADGRTLQIGSDLCGSPLFLRFNEQAFDAEFRQRLRDAGFQTVQCYEPAAKRFHNLRL